MTENLTPSRKVHKFCVKATFVFLHQWPNIIFSLRGHFSPSKILKQQRALQMLLNQRKRTIIRFVPFHFIQPPHDGLSRVKKPTRSMSLQANTPVEHSCTRNFSNRRQHQLYRASSLLTAKNTAINVSLMRTALQGMSWLSPAPSVLHKERNEPKQKLPRGQHRSRRDSVQPVSEDNANKEKNSCCRSHVWLFHCSSQISSVFSQRIL